MSLCRRQALLRLNPRKRIVFSATNSFVYFFFLKAGPFQQIILTAWHNSSSKFSLLWINIRICVYPLRQIPYLHWPPRQQFYQKWKVFPRRGFGSTSWPLARVSSNTTKCFWLRTEQRKRSVLDVRLKRRFALIMVELRASIELWICLCLQIFFPLFCGCNAEISPFDLLDKWLPALPEVRIWELRLSAYCSWAIICIWQRVLEHSNNTITKLAASSEHN